MPLPNFGTAALRVLIEDPAENAEVNALRLRLVQTREVTTLHRRTFMIAAVSRRDKGREGRKSKGGKKGVL